MNAQYDFILGIDLGKTANPSAFVLTQRTTLPQTDNLRHDVRFVWQLPLGTNYPLVVDAAEEIVASPLVHNRITIAADYTGPGIPVLDIMRCRPTLQEITYGITFTGGQNAKQVFMNYTVPKTTLVSTLLVVAQSGRLGCDFEQLDGHILKTEMYGFDMRKTSYNRTVYDTNDEDQQTHADTVMALCCAVWLGETLPIMEYTGGDGDFAPYQAKLGNLNQGLSPVGINMAAFSRNR